MQLAIQHCTRYRFSRPVEDLVQLLRLTPASCLAQTVLEWRIDVDCDARLRESRDGCGNIVHMLYVDEPLTEISITASGRVITEDRAGVVQGLAGDLPPDVFVRPTPLTAADDAIVALSRPLRGEPTALLSALHALNGELHGRLAFDVSSSQTSTTAAQALASGRGVCQDFAHILIAVARAAGVPARYISGHLFRRDGQEAQPAAHAWAELWVPDLGWVAFDPTNGICADAAYVRVAAGLDYADAAPIVGARRGGGRERMEVEVAVSEAPRRSQSQSQRQRGGGTQSQSQSQG